MPKTILIIFSLLFPIVSLTQKIAPTPFERDTFSTATYDEAITFYQKVANDFRELELREVGLSDVGRPIHTAILANQGDFSPEASRANNKSILFINNAIHPGEPCGVDASMLLVKDFLTNPDLKSQLDQVTIVIIPFYNIGGGLNRNSTTRVNQNGPKSYGFRGNAQHLDLNRDFIKCDSKNAQTFNQVFTRWMPDVFIDNHTSNGADYQYTITLIATQHNKLEAHLGQYMNQEMLPFLYQYMDDVGWEMTPYVFARSTPDKGIAGFLDLPRYSSGYAALFNAFSFMPETHMLKPFAHRVRSVHNFMHGMIDFMAKNGAAIRKVRQTAIDNVKNMKSFPISWAIDVQNGDSILFKGYEAKYKKSAITSKDRLYYDRKSPYEKFVPFYNNYKVTQEAEKPVAYIVPQSAHRVIERLQWNGVLMKRLQEDTEIEVDIYHIKGL